MAKRKMKKSLDKLKVSTLKRKLKKRGLSIKGKSGKPLKKAGLIRKLRR